MREIIQSVLATEAEAKRLLEEAQRNAEQTLAAARIRAEGIIQRSYQETKLEVAQILSAAEAEAAAKKESALAQLRVRLAEEVQLDPAMRAAIVQAAVGAICRTATDPERLKP